MGVGRWVLMVVGFYIGMGMEVRGRRSFSVSCRWCVDFGA